MTSTPALKAPTFRTLFHDPTTPIPYLVGGEITDGYTADIPEQHVQRLLTWAAISGVSPLTTVVVVSHLGGYDGFDPYVLRGLDLVLPQVEHRSVSDGSLVLASGWRLRLTENGATRDATLTDTGVVRTGLPYHQEEVLDRDRKHRERLARITSEAGTVRAVAAAAFHRQQTAGANSDADALWRQAITAAVDNGEKVPDVARAAQVTDKRVYQIHGEVKAARVEPDAPAPTTTS
ncbi:hypothetical protein [Saccharothrix sp. HUAS TT1]|uniref:hypothetical protein n=1 Tax=unclassified Saccharothrix TaxID=2593673 RepID=UPI00345C3510